LLGKHLKLKLEKQLPLDGKKVGKTCTYFYLGKSVVDTFVDGATLVACSSTNTSTYPNALFVPIFVHECAFFDGVSFAISSTHAHGYGPISRQGDHLVVGAIVNLVLIIPIVVGYLD